MVGGEREAAALVTGTIVLSSSGQGKILVGADDEAGWHILSMIGVTSEEEAEKGETEERFVPIKMTSSSLFPSAVGTVLPLGLGCGAGD